MNGDANAELRFFTLQEVAERLRMSERTLHRKLDNSEISAQFFARRWHFTDSDIQAYIKNSSKQRVKGVKKKRKYVRKNKETNG